MRNVVLAILLSVFTFAALPAAAHKMRVFAYGDATTISGEAAFGSRPARNIEVTVVNEADGATLVTVNTDESGNFSFGVPAEAVQNRLNLLLIADAGEGHQAKPNVLPHSRAAGPQMSYRLNPE